MIPHKASKAKSSRVHYCVPGIFYFTFILSFILLNLLCPIPGTSIISSIFLNFPFSSLYCIIVLAKLSPIPFRFCSSVLFALFMFIVSFCLCSSCFVSSVIIVSFSFIFGIYIFCPSSNS